MIIAGAVIVILTFAAIIKNMETRIVLIASGLLMGFIGGNAGAALEAFSKGLCNPTLTPVICVIMGFAAVLDQTGCSKHLVNVITGLLKHCKAVVIPATSILVFFLNTSIVSASGLAAAVGAILIPVLIRVGIHPAMAASAVLFGTWGASITPASPFLLQVLDISHEDVMDVLARFAPPTILIAIICCVILLAIAKLNKDMSYTGGAIVAEKKEEDFKPNYLYAAIPLVPIVVLLLSSSMIKLLPPISITNAMLLGTVLCFAVTRPTVKPFAKEFFSGMGRGFVSIVILIAAANVFISGMNSMGLVQSLIEAMEQSTAIAKISAVFGPFLVAAISGSGNAAVLAFNGAVTPFAPNFGMNISDMGACVQAGSFLGRTMSPVAGVTIICAEIAGVSPMDLTKRVAIPCIVAAVLLIIVVL